MIALVVLASLFFALMCVIGALAGVFSLVGFVFVLPFKILGWVLRAALLALGLPVVLLVGGAIALAGIAVAAAALIPFLPLLAVGALVWWLVRRDSRRNGNGSHASVVS